MGDRTTLIFSILPGAGWPGTGGTQDAEFAKGGWQHPSTYATAYDASRRNRQFHELKRNTKVALREQSRGVSSYHVLVRAFGDAFLET